jgi:hypothetical protein
MSELPRSTESHVKRIYEKLDDITQKQDHLLQTVTEIEAKCGPCSVMIDSHQRTLHGNGKEGLVTRMMAMERGRVDTLSIKSVRTLLLTYGTLTGTIAAAVGTLIGAILVAIK